MAAKTRPAIRTLRLSQGICYQCGDDPELPGLWLCATHGQAHRERNRRYEQSLRDSGHKQAMSTVMAEHEQRWAGQSAQLHALAASLGRVPKLSEVADLLGLAVYSSTNVQKARKRAFGLRSFTRIESGQGVLIPYPVPASWLDRS